LVVEVFKLLLFFAITGNGLLLALNFVIKEFNEDDLLA